MIWFQSGQLDTIFRWEKKNFQFKLHYKFFISYIDFRAAV